MTLPISILFVFVQAILLSLFCLFLYFAFWMASSRYKTTLLFSGLAAVASLWILAFVPIPNLTDSLVTWSESKKTERAVERVAQSPVALPASDRSEQVTAVDVGESEAFPANYMQTPFVESDIESLASPARSQFPGDNAIVLLGGLERMQSSAKKIGESSSLRPVQWLMFVFVALAVFGCLRLCVACWLLLSHRRQCTVLKEAAVDSTLNQIASKLNIDIKISVYESSKISSACTTGWLRPRIILPKTWRAWSGTELETVLAHEVIHVAHHDFVRQLIGQIGTAVHFYNPLAHWLLHRLRLEQELACDQATAALVGGRKVYVQCLASLALAQDNANDGWLSPMFLPTGKMLIQRVDRLRRQTDLNSGATSAAVRVTTSMLTWMGIATVAVSLAGFQIPDESNTISIAAPVVSAESSSRSSLEDKVTRSIADITQQAPTTVVGPTVATQDQSTTQAQPTNAKIGFVPPTTLNMMIIRLSRLAKHEATRDASSEAFQIIDESIQFLMSRAQIDSLEVEQITLLSLPTKITHNAEGKNLAEAAVVYTTTDIQARIKDITAGERNRANGLEYFRIANENNEQKYFVCLVDSHTLVAGTEAGIQLALNSRTDKSFLSRYDDWSKYAGSTGLMFAISDQAQKHRVGKPANVPKPYLVAFNEGHTRNQLDLIFFCPDARAARTQRVVLNEIKKTMIPALAEVKKQEATLKSEPDWEMYMILGELVQSMNCTVNDNECSASFEFATDSNWQSAFPSVLSKFFEATNAKQNAGGHTAVPNKNAVAPEVVAQFLAIKPRRPCDIDQPATNGSLSAFLFKTGNESGWILRDDYGRVYRKFFDVNGDRRLDSWIYFKDGKEVYRDVDEDFDGRADLHILAADVIQIFAEVDGLMGNIERNKGDVVVRGQELVRIHSHIPLDDISNQYSEVSKQIDQLLDRQTPRQDSRYEDVRTQLKYFRQQEKSLLAQLKILNAQKEKTYVRSPVDGRVLTWSAASGSQISCGQLLGTVLKSSAVAEDNY